MKILYVMITELQRLRAQRTESDEEESQLFEQCLLRIIRADVRELPEQKLLDLFSAWEALVINNERLLDESGYLSFEKAEKTGEEVVLFISRCSYPIYRLRWKQGQKARAFEAACAEGEDDTEIQGRQLGDCILRYLARIRLV